MEYRSYTIKRKPAPVRKLKPFQIAIMIAAIGIAIVFLCLFFGTNTFVDKSSTLMSTDSPLSETCEGTSNGIISVDNNKITYFDFEGFVVWSADKDPGFDNLSASDDAFALYNNMTTIVYDMKANPLFKVEMESPISTVVCGNKALGILVTQKMDASSSSFLHIYDFNGKETSVIEFTSKHILDIGFSGSNDTIYALSLDTTGVVPVCYITTYKTDGTITGSIPINTEILDKVLVTDTSIYASGTNSLTKFSYFGEEEASLLIYGWKPYDSFVSGSKMISLYTTRSEQSLSDDTLYNLKVIDENLSATMIYFPEALNCAYCSQSKIYAFGNNNIYIYDTQGNMTGTLTVEQSISSVKKLDSGYAIIWDNSQSYILKLY